MTINYKANLQYFIQSFKSKKNITRFVIAGVFALLALVFFLFIRFGHGLNLVVTLVFLAAAVGVLVSIFSSMVKEADIDDSVKIAKQQFESDLHDLFLPVDTHKNRSLTEERSKRKEYVPFETYYFGGEGLLVKKGSDGKHRTSRYCMNGIYLFPQEIGCGRRIFSLVEESGTTTETKICKYVELDRVALESAEIPEEYQGFSRYVNMTLYAADGSVFMQLPIIADSAADSLCDQLNGIILSRKKEAAEKEKAAQ